MPRLGKSSEFFEHAAQRGLPEASRQELHVARAITGLATLWFLGVALWEIAAPFGAGHYAASSAVALAGENMLRLKTLLPVTHYPLGPLSPADAYTHHPFGIFWTSALFAALFGHAEWVCRLPPLLLSTLTPPVLYLLGRALWSPLSGALAAVSFVLTPIALCFANFNALEVPVIFGTALTCLALVRLQQTGSRRFLWLALGALFYSMNTDWAAFVFAAAIWLLTAAAFGVRRDGHRAVKTGQRAFLIWGLLLILGTAGAYLIALTQLGKLDELWAQGRARAQGVAQPLWSVLRERQYWLTLMFTPFALGLGTLAGPLLVARAARFKNELELVPLTLLVMALFQYFVFKQGADVHVFWPHYFAPFTALGVAALMQTGRELGQWLARGHATGRGTRAWFLAASPLVLGFAVPALMAPDAWAALVFARKTGGRFNERGHFIQPDKDKVAALQYLSETTAPDARFLFDRSMRQSLWVPWVLGRPVRTTSVATLSGSDVFMTDGRFSGLNDLRTLGREYGVLALGPFWVIDARKPKAPLLAFSIEPREPAGLERFFVSSTHALRNVVPDPFWTWELRDHLNVSPNPLPDVEPKTFSQQRIAHNIARFSQDTRLAQQLRRRLLARLQTSSSREYVDGTRLLGIRFESGASDFLTVLFEASGPMEQRFRIVSEVEHAPAFSWVPKDPTRWEVGLGPSIAPREWKPGYLYSSVTELLRRPGREHYIGSWTSTRRAVPLHTQNGEREVLLLSLP